MLKKAKLYDCDNTLVLTETVAFRAGCAVVNELMERHGINERFLPEVMQKQWVGRTFRESVSQLALDYRFTIDDLDWWVEHEKQQVIKAFRPGLKPCAGAASALARTRAEGRCRMAVVSSSAKDRVLVSLEAAGLDGYFVERDVFSAQSCLESRRGKPAPDIYQHTLHKLALRAEDCIAFEDTIAGVTAAREAGIDVVGYLGCYEQNEMSVMGAALLAAGACALMPGWEFEEQVLAEVAEARIAS